MNGNLFINKTYSRNEYKGLLESILFVNGKPIRIEELTEIFETSGQDISTLIEELNFDYNEKKSGFHILKVAGGYQIVTNPFYKNELSELYGRKNENAITKSCLETLAIIVYKQPITKEEIDRIRGVSCTRSINTLLTLKFITLSGSSGNPEKSPLYSSTDRFLEYFRIKSLEDLPPITSSDMEPFFGDMSDLDSAFSDGPEDMEPDEESEGSIF